MDKRKVLVVDSDRFFLRFCAECLAKAGFVAVTSSSSEGVVDACAGETVSLVLVDVHMPGKSGIQLLEEIKSLFPMIDVIVTASYASVESAVQAFKRGASDYLRKPISVEELTASVTGTLERRKLYQDNAELKGQLRLYELSRSFSSVEEPQRVAALGLDAMREITGATCGFCAMEVTDGRCAATPAVRNLPKAMEERLGSIVERLAEVSVDRELPAYVEGTEFQAIFGSEELGGLVGAFIVPLRADDHVCGYIVLMGGSGVCDFTVCSTSSAQFLGGQIALAFRAALRFQEAKGLAYIDSLTGLYNQHYLPVVLEKCFAQSDLSEKPASILFIDLDDFRGVNARFGHLAGSKTLIEVAWILGDNVRSGDTVVRFGGDEFTVVLPATDTQAAREIAERIRRSIMSHVFLTRDSKALNITACIGVATYPTHARNIELLINLADQAMYQGKNHNRNVVNVAAAG